jgi:hypothetical protein
VCVCMCMCKFESLWETRDSNLRVRKRETQYFIEETVLSILSDVTQLHDGTDIRYTIQLL